MRGGSLGDSEPALAQDAAHVRRSTWRSVAWPISFLLLALVKLALVANNEIVAAYRPHDDYWYIRSAMHWVWWRPYDEWTLMHLPVYPLFIAITGSLGLPLRLSIELFYIAGATILSASLARLGLSRPLQAVAFVLIVFHPYSLAMLDYALAETMYTCLLLFFIAFFVRVIKRASLSDSRWSTLLFSCTAALLWHCRKESVLIAGLLAVMGVVIIGIAVVGALAWRQAFRWTFALVAAPLAAAVLLGAIISAANGMRYGLWHTNQMVAPNFVRAYSTLQAVRPARSLRFIPVAREVRQKAYEASAAFRELAPFFEGEPEPWFMTESRRWVGLPGEVGAGWFYWALVDTAARAGHFRTAEDSEAFFGRIADELTAAFNEGRLPSRHAPLPFVDPALPSWIPYLPGSFVKVALVLFPSRPPILPDRPLVVSAEVLAAFDVVANRRAKTGRRGGYVAEGWVLSSSSRPIQIEVVDAKGNHVQTSFERGPRPDVPPVRGSSGRPGPEALGFTIGWPSQDGGAEPLRLRAVLEGGESAVSEPVLNLPLGRGIRLTASSGDSEVFLALDRLEGPKPFGCAPCAGYLQQWYPIFLSLVAMGSGLHVLLAVSNRGFVVPKEAVVALLFVLEIILSRVLLFAVLDASAWAGDQTRYLFPVAALVPIVPIILFSFGRPVRWRTMARLPMDTSPRADIVAPHSPDSAALRSSREGRRSPVRLAAAAFIAGCLIYIGVRYVLAAALNYDDLGYAHNLPIVVSQRGYFRSLLMLLFNTDLGRAELRTYGLARAIQMFTWTAFGSRPMPVFVLMLAAHAASAAALAWTLRTVVTDRATRHLVALAWFASPFILPIIRTEHHFLYILAPFYLLIGWIGYVLNVMAVKSGNLPTRHFLIGLGLLVAIFWTGESVIPSAIASGIVLSVMLRRDEATSRSVIGQTAAAVALLALYVEYQKLFVADPALGQRFKLSLPASFDEFAMRLGWVWFASREVFLGALGFDFYDSEVGRTMKVAGLQILDTWTFWFALAAVAGSLSVLAAAHPAQLPRQRQKAGTILGVFIIASSAFALYYGNMLIGQGSTFAVRYTSACYTIALISIPITAAVLSQSAGRHVAIVVASLCLAFTASAMWRIDEVVDQPRLAIEKLLLEARTQGKEAVLVAHVNPRVSASTPVDNNWPGLGSPYSYVTSDAFRSFWTTSLYLRTVLGFKMVGTSFREIDADRVEIINDLIHGPGRRIYQKRDVYVAGIDSSAYPVARPNLRWFADWDEFARTYRQPDTAASR